VSRALTDKGYTAAGLSAGQQSATGDQQTLL
jgi:hypothetical protein